MPTFRIFRCVLFILFMGSRRNFQNTIQFFPMNGPNLFAFGFFSPEVFFPRFVWKQTIKKEKKSIHWVLQIFMDKRKMGVKSNIFPVDIEMHELFSRHPSINQLKLDILLKLTTDNAPVCVLCIFYLYSYKWLRYGFIEKKFIHQHQLWQQTSER